MKDIVNSYHRQISMSVSSRLIDSVAYIGSLAMATVLLYTGLVHASQPYFFAYSSAAYQMVPDVLLGVACLFLPYLQIVLSVCIFLRLAQPAAFVLASLLFAIYAYAQCSVLIRRIPIDCGCFGYTRTPVSWQSAMVPISLALLAAVLSLFWLWETRKAGLNMAHAAAAANSPIV